MLYGRVLEFSNEKFPQFDFEDKVKLKERRNGRDLSRAIHNAARKAWRVEVRREALGCMHGSDGGTWGV